MEIQIDKNENQISLKVMISLATAYGKAMEEELNIDNSIQEPDYISDIDDNIVKSTNTFLNNLISLNDLLVISNKDRRQEIDQFISILVNGIFSTVCPMNIYCLDLRSDSIFNYNSFISQRITDIDDCFEVLTNGAIEDNPEVQNYIIVNECIDFFMYDCDKFIQSIKQLLSRDNYHIILLCSEPELLTEELLVTMSHYCVFWLGSTRASKAIFHGKNVACNPQEPGYFLYSFDKGTSYSTESIEYNIYPDDQELDI